MPSGRRTSSPARPAGAASRRRRSTAGSSRPGTPQAGASRAPGRADRARPESEPEPTPAPRRPRSMVRVVAFVAVLGALALFLTPTLRGYLDQRGQLADLQTQVAETEQDVSDLEGQLQDWEDPAFVERQARERLRFVMPGEVAYTVIDDTPEQVLADELPGIAGVPDDGSQSRPWYGEVWESVVSTSSPAGTPAQPDDTP